MAKLLDMYTLSEFIKALRTITAKTHDSRKIISQVKPLAQRLALSKTWLIQSYYKCDPKQGFGVHLLYQEPEVVVRSLTLTRILRRRS